MILVSYRTKDVVDSVGVLVSGNELIDLAPLFGEVQVGRGFSAMRRLLCAAADGPMFDTAKLDRLPRLSLDSVRISPVVPDPSKIIAAPVNYRDHQVEMNQQHHVDGLGVFLKAPSSVTAHQATIRLPYSDRRFDQEGELAVVIGRAARDVSAEHAAEVVAGYTCLLDITMRGGEDRSTRKSFDTFTPMGPHLVTPDEVGDISSLRLRTSVNGSVRQDATIGDLIWDVPRLISYVSSVMTLVPGDVVTTGTPAGVGPIYDGDTVTVEIERVGTLSVSVSAEGAAACPTQGAGRGPQPPPPPSAGRPCDSLQD